MKKLKKLLSIVLAVAMVMSLAVSVTADNYTINISNTKSGETYTAYKIFDATYNDNTGSYSYSLDTSTSDGAAIYTWLTSTTSYGDYFDLTLQTGSLTTYVVTQKDTFTTSVAASLAADLKKAIDADTLSLTEAGYTTASGDTATITISNADPGYYFVNTTLGALAVLHNFGGDEGTTISISDKNGEPTVSKGVSDDGSSGSYDTDSANSGANGDSDAAIGDLVYYETTITDVDNQTKLVLHDEMTNGLTFNSSSVLVTLHYKTDSSASSYIELSLSDGSTYDLKYVGGTNEPSDTCTFEIDFAKLIASTAYSSYVDAYIVVTYTATVNSDAVIYDSTATTNSNDNETKVDYGNASTTAVDETNTYVYSVNLYKYTGGSNAGGTLSGETGLAGAQFYLYNSNYSKVAEFTYDSTTNTYKLNGWVAVDGIDSFSATATDVIVITSVADSEINIEGLDAETLYYLHEIVAPSGYNLAATDTPFYIAGSDVDAPVVQGYAYTSSSKDTLATVTADTLTGDPTVIAIVNNSGSEMPETGGIGVTIFYVVGGILVLAAAGVIVINRKKTK